MLIILFLSSSLDDVSQLIYDLFYISFIFWIFLWFIFKLALFENIYFLLSIIDEIEFLNEVEEDDEYDDDYEEEEEDEDELFFIFYFLFTLFFSTIYKIDLF